MTTFAPAARHAAACAFCFCASFSALVIEAVTPAFLNAAAIAANDNLAGAVVAQLKAKHLKPIPLSGQDATVEGAQYIISGWQTGTVYKPVPKQAAAAAAAAIALLKGKPIAKTTVRNNGKKNVPTVALPVTWITKSNINILYRDKFIKKSAVCVGEFKKYC